MKKYKQTDINFKKTYMKYITGDSERGISVFEKGTRIRITKEKDNEYDNEAIKAELPGLGKVGYVANSVKTRIGESSSAGRIYVKCKSLNM